MNYRHSSCQLYLLSNFVPRVKWHETLVKATLSQWTVEMRSSLVVEKFKKLKVEMPIYREPLSVD